MGFKKQNIFFRWLLFLIANSDKPNKNIVRGTDVRKILRQGLLSKEKLSYSEL